LTKHLDARVPDAIDAFAKDDLAHLRGHAAACEGK
jgi:hypothetical protein